MSDDSTPQDLPSTPAIPPTEPAAPASSTAPKRPFTLPRSTFLFVRMFIGLAVLLGLGYFALVALNPKARAWATQGGRDGRGGPTPFKSLNRILSIPARAGGKTKDVVAASDARVGVPNNVIASESGKPGRDGKPLTDIFSKPAATAEPGEKASAGGADADDQNMSREKLPPPPEKNAATASEEASNAAVTHSVPATPPRAPGPPKMKLGGGIVITNCPAPDAIPASGPFMYWVASLSVGGVSNGTPARFLMNGRLVHEGDDVNKALAITFDRLDAAAKLIYFRDKSGAMVSRSY